MGGWTMYCRPDERLEGCPEETHRKLFEELEVMKAEEAGCSYVENGEELEESEVETEEYEVEPELLVQKFWSRTSGPEVYEGAVFEEGVYEDVEYEEDE